MALAPTRRPSARQLAAASIAAVAIVCQATHAAIDPFTESFADGHANWGGGGDWTTFDPLDWNASGGPDGGALVSATENFSDFEPGAFPLTLFRGQDNFGSSDNAFVGNWIESGFNTFSFWVRHDAPVDLEFFVRFTPVDANSPSMNFEFVDDHVAPDTWTKLSLDLSPDNPGWVVGGPPNTYNSVFSNLGKIQIGANVDPLAGLEQDVSFDLAQVTVPAPGALSLLALAGFLGARRRRVT